MNAPAPTHNAPATAPSNPVDPRPIYAAATTWMTELLRNVDAAQLSAPTPCDEFDVRTLASHITGTALRADAAAAGRPVMEEPFIADTFDADTYAEIVGRANALWADDALLGTPITVPWGTVPGAGVLWGYLNETLVHGWDLAVATGQPAEADPAIVAPVSEVFRKFLPADMRGDEVPFGPVVTPREGAGPTERLANWSGRVSATWIG